MRYTMPKTNFQRLTDISDAARRYAARSATVWQNMGLTIDGALQIAEQAEQDRAALTVEQAAQMIDDDQLYAKGASSCTN
jgi:hypothetical protein